MIKKIFQSSFRQLVTLTVALLIAFLVFLGVSVVRSAWSEPTADPPFGNVAAPINVGGIYQVKLSAAGLAGPENPSGSIGANDFFVSSVNGWVSNLFIKNLPECQLLASSPVGISGNQAVAVPQTCLNSSCVLSMLSKDASGVVEEIVGTEYLQYISGATNPIFWLNIVDWWVKTGIGADGVSCNRGRNGTLQGCDAILRLNDNLRLNDDFPGFELTAQSWTLKDTDLNSASDLFVCD